jgi:hypothetical protein
MVFVAFFPAFEVGLWLVFFGVVISYHPLIMAVIAINRRVEKMIMAIFEMLICRNPEQSFMSFTFGLIIINYLLLIVFTPEWEKNQIYFILGLDIHSSLYYSSS